MGGSVNLDDSVMLAGFARSGAVWSRGFETLFALRDPWPVIEPKKLVVD